MIESVRRVALSWPTGTATAEWGGEAPSLTEVETAFHDWITEARTRGCPDTAAVSAVNGQPFPGHALVVQWNATDDVPPPPARAVPVPGGWAIDCDLTEPDIRAPELARIYPDEATARECAASHVRLRHRGPTPDRKPRDIGDLITASSLGTPEAVAARASVTDEQAKATVDRAKELRGHWTAEPGTLVIATGPGKIPWMRIYQQGGYDGWVSATGHVTPCGGPDSPQQNAGGATVHFDPATIPGLPAIIDTDSLRMTGESDAEEPSRTLLATLQADLARPATPLSDAFLASVATLDPSPCGHPGAWWTNGRCMACGPQPAITLHRRDGSPAVSVTLRADGGVATGHPDPEPDPAETTAPLAQYAPLPHPAPGGDQAILDAIQNGPDQLIDRFERIRDWLRYHGDYTLTINPWGAYGLWTITLTGPKAFRRATSGATLGKRLTEVESWFAAIDTPGGA